MEKTNVTFIQPLGWISSRVGQSMQWMLAGLMLFFVTSTSMAQTSSPNCTDVNASVDATGYISVAVGEFVTNCADAEAVDYTVYNQYGGVVATVEDAACTDLISFYACNALGRTYSVNFSNDLGACWSELTFKQSNGPTIVGNAFYLYCLESEVSDVDMYIDRFYGNNDDKLQDSEYKPGVVPCVGEVRAEFVADWVTPYECVLGEDTAKVILREFEAFDKAGNRGSAFDTLYVWRLPEITVDNIYCAEKDTVYCGVGSSPGPYMVLPKIDSTTGIAIPGECDTIPFLTMDTENGELVCEPATFDTKCGISIHFDKWKFDDPCSPQYKIDIEIKQSCYGAAQADCVVDPAAAGPGTPNAFEPIAEGYWKCSFWLIDLDTVPPIADCKFDKNSHNVLWPSDFFFEYYGSDSDHEYHCYYTPKDPVGDCIAPVILVPTGSHDCAAHTYIPPLCVRDDWSGIKQVKARIPGVGSWILEETEDECDQLDNVDYECDPDYNVKGICYVSHQSVKIPKTEEPVQVMYEIYDNCHNIDTVYAYLLVKDQTKPVAVADKGVTVSLSSKKVWVDAETFDEGSWDNCGVNLLLARRTDWYDFCIDLCDDTASWCEGKHGERLYTAFLNEDKHDDEVEAHYAKTLDWLCNDGVPCGEIIYNAWLYDLAKYATLYCVDHPYDVDDQYFRHLFEKCYEDYYYGPGAHQLDIDPSDAHEYYFDRWKYVSTSTLHGCRNGGAPLSGELVDHDGLSTADRELIDTYEQIGGGWSEDVPFDCTDACAPVTVEILVMDYWCNWSKNWTKVWVEDKTPVSIVKDVIDDNISCGTYKSARYDYPGADHPVSAEWIVEQAKAGEEDAYDALDDIFGGYCKAWVDPYGNYVDAAGDEIVCEIPFSDSICECTTYEKEIRVYDEHLGYIWVDSQYTECYNEKYDKEFQKGIVVVNCADNVHCKQDVWCDIDHCGQGYIYRKWKIWQGCPPNDDHTSGHIPDTITRVQKIKVGNYCGIQKEMFDVPGDTEVYACGITYDEDGSGNVSGEVDPSITGYPEYKFDDDCRIIGIAHEDKVFKIVGGDAGCYKIVRTWYFADWCTNGKRVDGAWWRDGGYDDYCVQKIIVIDTMPPACTITGPANEDGVIEAAGCEYDFSASVSLEDACGVSSYYWELVNVGKDPNIVEASGSGSLEDGGTSFDVTVEKLLSGTYKLKVRATDDCQNESYCTYDFSLETGKKPTPVCITSLTVELTPWDTDNDGEADTAAAEVWASEFDRSSQAPCGFAHEELDFRVEFLGDDNDSLDLDLDSAVLRVGCEHAGTQMVRLWVISPTGSFDYCDVLLVVQTNMDGCGDASGASAIRGVVTTELNTNVEQVEVTATLGNGQILNGVTTVQGAYAVATNVIGETVSVTPKKDIGWDNGVSTLDLVKIQKHILGKATLESEMREVAADVNNDGKVSALDLLEIRKLILGKTDQFANVGSWKFFSKINNEETYVIENIAGVMELDWTGVKMGDVDYSNDPSRSAGRSGKSLVFNVDNAELIAGNQYKVDFKAGNFNDITGYQFTINFDNNALKVLNVESGVLEVSGDNFGLDRMEEGIVTTSWNAGEGMSIATDEVVFSLIVEAKDVASLSNALTVNSKVTAAEAYNSADQIHEVSLNFTSDLTEAGFALYQNEPNPFKESTRVSFNLPEAMSATLTIYDVTGKVLKVIENDYSKGYNQVSIEQKDLKVTGVLYYQLDTEAFTATKRMIIVD